MNKKISEKIQVFKEMLDREELTKDFGLEDIADPDKMEEAIEKIIDFASKLAKVYQYSPESIYLADKDGVTISVNKAFAHTVGVSAESVVGKNVCDLEAQGAFRPSVLRLTKEENRTVSILQSGSHGEPIIATGVPLFDGNGNLELLLSNARLTEEIEGLYSYVYEKKNRSEQKDIHGKDLVLRSESMKQISFLAEQVKDTDATILITGESGVGKGVIARHLHNMSERASKAIVEINCGAIPENLIESELFGYTAGAFTGASAGGKEGLIEAADGGTLFLDEIGELPLSMQVKLLKVLQDKQIVRIGGTSCKKVDIRIIAATNQNLKELVKRGGFRADLYYRLNVIPIEIPPLRERKKDIEAAVQYFAEKFAAKYNRSIECTKEFTKNALAYEWPGNMRELENYVERAVLTSNDGVLHATLMERVAPVDYDKLLQSEDKLGGIKNYVDSMEEQVVRELYEKHRSSYKVADELGVSQSKAYRLIKKYCRQ